MRIANFLRRAGVENSGASQQPYWFRSGEALCCQRASFAITDMGRSGVRNTPTR